MLMLSSSTALDLEEGSGDLTMLDQEDGDTDSDIYEPAEGSGGWQLSSSWQHSKQSDYSSNFNDQDYYYDDNYEYFDSIYTDKDGDNVDDGNLLDYLDTGVASAGGASDIPVFEEETEIEIAAKPTGGSEDEQIVLNVSQILIMVGSSFISFAIFMLTFFLCRRMITNKARKNMPYPSSPEKVAPTREPPIVKDYQKVPSSTQEMMKAAAAPTHRLNMYGGDSDPENPSAVKLVP